MARRIGWILLAVALWAPEVMAILHSDSLDVNRWKFPITNYGIFGMNMVRMSAGGEWPQGSGHMYIFGAGLWVGAIQGDTYTAVGYNPNSGRSELCPGDSLGGLSDSAARIYVSTEQWPPPIERFPRAPQVARSNEDAWCCFNDFDTTLMETLPGPHGRSLGLQVYMTGYASTRFELRDAILLRLEIENQHADPLQGIYAGIAIDPDIGNASNDYYRGFYHRRLLRPSGDSVYLDHLACAYSGAESGWDTTGSIGVILIRTPGARGAATMKRFTLQSGDPYGDVNQYLALAGYDWWTYPPAYNPIDSLDTAPADKRFLLATGPFDLAPGQSETLVAAIVAANSVFPFTDPSRLVEAAWLAESLYFAGPLLDVTEDRMREPGSALLISGPTIVRGTLVWSATTPSLRNVGDIALHTPIALLDICGRRALDLHPGPNDVSRLAPGVYFIRESASRARTTRVVVTR